MAKKATNSEFAELFQTAKKNLSKPVEQRQLQQESFSDEHGMSLTVRRKLWFLPEGDFATVYNMTAREAGAKIETLSTSSGHHLTGVFVANSDPWQEIFVDWTLHTARQRRLLDMPGILRPGQAEDYADCWRSDLQKRWPPSLTKNITTTVEDLQALVDKKRQADREAQEQARLQAAGLAAENAASTIEENQDVSPEEPLEISEGSEVDEELVAAGVCRAVPGQEHLTPTRKRGKGRGRGGQVLKPGQKRSSSATDNQPPPKQAKPLSRPSVLKPTLVSGAASTIGARSERSRSPAGQSQVGGKSTPSTRHNETLLAQSDKHRQTLSVAYVLSGVSSIGSDVMQAYRCLKAMKTKPRMECEVVSLEAHLALVEKAKCIDLDRIVKCTQTTRQECLECVLPKLTETPIPEWCAALLSCVVRDTLESALNEEMAAEVAKQVVPRASSSGL